MDSACAVRASCQLVWAIGEHMVGKVLNMQLIQLSILAPVQVAASVTETCKALHAVSSFPACACAGGYQRHRIHQESAHCPQAINHY